MIRRTMTHLPHKRSTEIVDDYGQCKHVYSDLGDINIAIYTKDPKIQYTSPVYLNATHIGLTQSKDVKVNDTIGNYKVDFVEVMGRYTQLILSEVL